MKIVSWNLLHRNGAELDEILALVRRESPDLLLLQEATDAVDALPDRLGGHYVRHPLPGRRHGLAAWSARPFQHTRSLRLEPGMVVRRLCQMVTLGGVTVANVHLSHGQWLNRRQLRQIFAALPPRAAVLGDCNMVGPPPVMGFHEAGPNQPTHWAGRLLPLRLDRCFIRNLDCLEARVLAKGGSDHHPILVRLSA